MKYVVFTIFLAVLKESYPLNPEILKYEQYMTDFEATGRRIKQEAKEQKVDGSILKRESSNMINVGKNHSVQSVLMVCTGNYASSPIAKAVFEDLAKKKGVDSEWRCDSAGLDLCADKTMSEQAEEKLKEHGIEPGNHTCRQVTEEDLNAYDYVLAMDKENLKDLRGIALAGFTAKLELLPSYDPRNAKIIKHPDLFSPTFAYEEIFQIANRSCNAFLDKHSNIPSKT